MQTPQGFDATHGGELFPITESRRTPTLLTLGRAPSPAMFRRDTQRRVVS